MPSWWRKSSSKDVKKKASKGSFIDAIHRKFKSGSEGKKNCKSVGSGRFANDNISEKGLALSRSALCSVQVSRCQSFAEELHAHPLPLPGADSDIHSSKLELHGCPQLLSVSHLSRHVCKAGKPLASDAWGDLAFASVSSFSSMDTDDQPDSRILSPQASDYESGNITAINSPSSKRNKGQSTVVTRRILMEQPKPLNRPSNNHTPLTSTRRREAFTAHITQLQIPPRGGFFSAPGSSISSPSRSPVRVCGHEKVISSGLKPYSNIHYIGSGHCCSPGSGQTSGHNSVGGDIPLFWPQSRCSPEYSPISSPKLTSPCPSSRVHGGRAIPLHPRARGSANGLSLDKFDGGKPMSHRLPLPPVKVSTSSPLPSSYSANLGHNLLKNPGQAESSTSPVSRWKKGRLVGSGTFGHVYLGFNSEIGEMCVMKEVTLFLDDAKSKESVQQLEQEITLLSCLRHPNIVRYFGSETVGDKLYIYLEYVSGGSIHKLLRQYGRLGESAIRSYTQQILCGLAYLHARNTVHRDIKGANILVDPSGQVKLADFGMAKHITRQPCPLSFKGSPYWMAPEVIRNSDGCNLAVDIWSLGCTVIEMATAKPPWSQYEGVAALFKIGNSKELPAIPDHLSEEGKDFVRQCLQRNPLDRPSAIQLMEHPFVRNAALFERSMICPKTSESLHTASDSAKDVGHVNVFSGLHSRVAVQLHRDFNIVLRSSGPSKPKHLSCPVSPIGSPLLRPKTSQPTCRTRSPITLSPHTLSGSSTPYTTVSSALAKHRFYHSRTHSESLHGIPEVPQGSEEKVSSQNKLRASRFVQLVHYKQHSTLGGPSMLD